jgi:hypothetical protein
VIQRALAAAETSWLNPHLLIRLHGLSVRAATTPEQVEEAILRGDRMLAAGNTC